MDTCLQTETEMSTKKTGQIPNGQANVALCASAQNAEGLVLLQKLSDIPNRCSSTQQGLHCLGSALGHVTPQLKYKEI